MSGAVHETALAAEAGVWRRGGVRIPEAVRRYGLGRTTLYGLLNSGAIPYALIPGGRLISVAALEDWLAAQTVSGKAK